MPYVKQVKRGELEQQLKDVGSKLEVKGDLTYSIYKLGVEFLKSHEKNYQNISDCIAAMNDSAAEFRRRILNKYEDAKINENGDIV